ncbi:MAG: hypothetical protein Q9208_001611 [Pyrenodesmia sp. 3 TL-2023]
MRHEYKHADMHFLKIVDVSAPDQILGYAKWTVEEGQAASGVREERARREEDIAEDGSTAGLAPFDPPDVPDKDTCVELFNDWLPELVKKRHRYLVEAQTLVLDDLWVLPEYQRQGVGTIFLGCLINYADERGLPCYLESTPLALPMYRAHGFQEVDKTEINLAKWREGYGVYKSAVLYRDAGKSPEHQGCS